MARALKIGFFFQVNMVHSLEKKIEEARHINNQYQAMLHDASAIVTCSA